MSVLHRFSALKKRSGRELVWSFDYRKFSSLFKRVAELAGLGQAHLHPYMMRHGGPSDGQKMGSVEGRGPRRSVAADREDAATTHRTFTALQNIQSTSELESTEGEGDEQERSGDPMLVARHLLLRLAPAAPIIGLCVEVDMDVGEGGRHDVRATQTRC